MFTTLRRIGLKGAAYKFVARLFPQDSQIRAACDRIGAYRYLKKYECVLREPRPSVSQNDENKKPDIIWLCWFQGYDNAPFLVQKCRDSIIKHNPDKKIVVVDNSNLEQYIQLPEYIERKHDEGIIPHAHYADLIRITLLAQHGGTWIDTTVYATNKLPEYISQSELFCYKVAPFGKTVASNWLISAAPNNPIILQMKSLLYEYWKNENKLVSYSIFHLFWTMTVEFNENNAALWHKVPYFDDVNCKILQMGLFDQYSDERFQQIKSMSGIHKLTYKFPEESTQLENTFYKFIIQ